LNAVKEQNDGAIQHIFASFCNCWLTSWILTHWFFTFQTYILHFY